MSTWIIAGLGAIGSLYGCALQRAGHSVLYWHPARQHRLHRQLRSSHFQLKEQSNHQFDALQLNAEYRQSNESLRLLVTTKAMQVPSVLASLLPQINHPLSVVLCHNGMGTWKFAQTAAQPQHQLFAAVTTDGALKEGENIQHTGAGAIHLGSIQPLTVNRKKLGQQLIQELNTAKFNATWEDNILEACWQKLAINCAINPLTALYQCKNGELLDQGEKQQQLHLICDEVIKVMDQLGLETIADGLTQRVEQVAQLTAENRSSMYEDIRAKRETEIEAITGYFCQQANQLGIHTPFNHKLLQEIRKRQSQF